MALAQAEMGDVKLVLQLTQEEAERLKAMMQNEWHNNEGSLVKDLRSTVWHALDDAGVAST